MPESDETRDTIVMPAPHGHKGNGRIVPLKEDDKETEDCAEGDIENQLGSSLSEPTPTVLRANDPLPPDSMQAKPGPTIHEPLMEQMVIFLPWGELSSDDEHVEAQESGPFPSDLNVVQGSNNIASSMTSQLYAGGTNGLHGVRINDSNHSSSVSECTTSSYSDSVDSADEEF